MNQHKTLHRFLLFIPIIFIVLFVVISVLRIGYPFELEWMEGTVLDHVDRVLAGKQIYVEPSPDFVPYIYPPLYYWVSAAATKIIGYDPGLGAVSFVPLRLVSFLSTIGCFVVLFFLVKNEVKSFSEKNANLAGLFSAGLFAACFKLTGGWYDLARVDSLFMFLLLAGIFVLRIYGDKIGGMILSAIIFALAFLTKQQALIIVLPIMVYLAWRYRLKAVIFEIVFFLLAIIPILAINQQTNYWYFFYIFTLPSGHELKETLALTFFLEDLLYTLPVVCVFLVYLGYRYRKNLLHDRSLFLLSLVIGMGGASLFSRMHHGGYYNVLMPVYALIAILTALAIPLVLERVKNASNPALITITIAAIVIQSILLFYRPADYLPTKENQDAGNDFVNRLSRINGDVLVYEHGFYARLAGKPGNASKMAIYDVLRGKDERASEFLRSAFMERISNRHYGAIITNEDWMDDSISVAIKENYPDKKLLFTDPDVFYPPCGYGTRPTMICFPGEKH